MLIVILWSFKVKIVKIEYEKDLIQMILYVKQMQMDKLVQVVK